MKKINIIKKCRSCNSKELRSVLSLGKQPLANSLKSKQFITDEKFSLSISFCLKCKLIQLNETILKSKLFDEYVWVTGTGNKTIVYLKNLLKNIKNLNFISKNDFVIEIASNDGSFLKVLKSNGYKKILGVDPAKNLAKLASKEGLKTLNDYWSFKVAKKIDKKYGKANLVVARNVIPHVSNLIDVIKGIKFILSEKGVGLIEFHDASKIFKELHYDSIYHEHLNYFSLNSIENLLKNNNLFPFHVEHSPISGGSLVVFFDNGINSKTKNYEKRINFEKKNKINDYDSWINFGKKVKLHKIKVLDFIKKNKNKKIIGFGSSARSQTFLNYTKINYKKIEAIIDNNKLKQNLFSPGTDIPILDFSKAIKLNADLILILAWNFKEEIIIQCKKNGFKGKFITAFPNKISESK